MKRKKSVVALMLLAAVLGLAVGCGKEDTPPNSQMATMTEDLFPETSTQYKVTISDRRGKEIATAGFSSNNGVNASMLYLENGYGVALYESTDESVLYVQPPQGSGTWYRLAAADESLRNALLSACDFRFSSDDITSTSPLEDGWIQIKTTDEFGKSRNYRVLLNEDGDLQQLHRTDKTYETSVQVQACTQVVIPADASNASEISGQKAADLTFALITELLSKM